MQYLPCPAWHIIECMISQLTGTVAHLDLRYVILDVHGVGYRLSISTDTVEKLSRLDSEKIEKGSGQSPIKLWTYLAVREDALDLYGFLDQDSLRFFEQLITVNGVGPKTAMGILSGAPIGTLRRAIASGDASHLVKMAGVGRKMAEKLLLELKDKMSLSSGDSAESSAALKGESDAIEALQALGYSSKEAREALQQVDASITKAGERVKRALKILGSPRG